MNQLKVTGSLFECAKQIGKHYQAQIKWRLKFHKINQHAVKKHQPLLQEIYNHVQIHTPECIEEIKGLAQGSNLDFWQLFLLNCPELEESNHGCTGIAQVTTQKIILAHNEDSHPAELKKSCALLSYTIPNRTFTSFTYLGELPGNAYSWNNFGLYVTVNTIEVKRFNYSFIPRYFIARKLIEAKSINQAINILKTCPNLSGFHYFIGQGKRLVSIEQYHHQLNIKPVTSFYHHTNHFIQDNFSKVCNQPTGSKKRYTRVQELKSHDLHKILLDTKNRPYSIYARSSDVNRTLSTVFFYPQQNQVKIYSAKNPEPLELLLNSNKIKKVL